MLSNRMYKYLQKTREDKGNDFWISYSKLSILAQKKGYAFNQIKKAVEGLDDKVDVAKVFDNKGVRYRFVMMDVREKKSLENDLKWFNSLK